MNKTLKREYKVANDEVQEQYAFIVDGGRVADINKALAYMEKLPILNSKPVRVRNRKGQMIALVGTKGTIQKFNSDYYKKNWYFDGNRLGKKKQLQAAAFMNDDLLESINTDGLDRVWKKISSRINRF